MNDQAEGLTPRISVVVPHYNDLARLDLVLRALAGQDEVEGGYEIIVADNASPAGEAAVRAVIADRARFTLVREKGAGAARNGGVALARGEILAFTDADCIPDPAWLARGVRALEAFDFVGGRMKVLVDDPDRMTSAEAFEVIFAFDNKTYVERKGFTVTANLFCRRALFETVGGFVTAAVSEDMDWCFRARDAGYRIGYEPASIVGHPARRTWTELVVKTRRISTELFGLELSGRGGRLAWLLKTLAMPLSAMAHSPKVLFGGAVPRISTRFGALVVLYRLRLWRFAFGLQLLGRSLAPGGGAR